MKIILISDYNGLGKAGDLLDVKPGFARNMLLPKGLALRASKKNIALIDLEKSIPKESIYFDSDIHLNEKGSSLAAEKISNVLIKEINN